MGRYWLVPSGTGSLLILEGKACMLPILHFPGIYMVSRFEDFVGNFPEYRYWCTRAARFVTGSDID